MKCLSLAFFNSFERQKFSMLNLVTLMPSKKHSKQQQLVVSVAAGHGW
jgi:hypothetical protein